MSAVKSCNGAVAFPIDRVFNRLLNIEKAFGEDGFARSAFPAPVAVWQDENHVYVEVELPGVTENELDLTFHNGELAITAERKAPENRQYLFNNRAFGKVRRTINLPDGVDAEGIDATFTGGVLLLSCPKKAEIKPRKIQIKGS